MTFRLRRDGADVVLRRGPRPPLPKSTHDMVREARIQLALAPLGMPVPRILAVCEDDSVLGVPFYVMEHLDGTVLTDTVPPHLDALEARRATSEAVVDTLADLHSLDVSGGEIATDRPARGLPRTPGRPVRLAVGRQHHTGPARRRAPGVLAGGQPPRKANAIR